MYTKSRLGTTDQECRAELSTGLRIVTGTMIPTVPARLFTENGGAFYPAELENAKHSVLASVVDHKACIVDVAMACPSKIMLVSRNFRRSGMATHEGRVLCFPLDLQQRGLRSLDTGSLVSHNISRRVRAFVVVAIMQFGYHRSACRLGTRTEGCRDIRSAKPSPDPA